MVRKSRAKKPKTSGLEKEVEQWLIDAGIPYQTQKAISRIHCDLFLPDTNTCVEVNGCYWHHHNECMPAGEITFRVRWDTSRSCTFRKRGLEMKVPSGCCT